MAIAVDLSTFRVAYLGGRKTKKEDFNMSGQPVDNGIDAVGGTLLTEMTCVVKLIGELANVTAQTVSTEAGSATKQSKSSTNKASGGLKTVICTELHRQGLLSHDLYAHPAAIKHFLALHPYTIAGYQFWGVAVAERMRTSGLLSHLMLPVAEARYRMVTTGRFNMLGAATLYIGQPICFIIGALVNLGARYGHIGA